MPFFLPTLTVSTKGHNDGNDHAQRKAEHIGRLDGQNAGDAADADGVGRVEVATQTAAAMAEPIMPQMNGKWNLRLTPNIAGSVTPR